ncbi:MAG: hypothetical protein AAF682_11570 [Planctomycetota bacterium]
MRGLSALVFLAAAGAGALVTTVWLGGRQASAESSSPELSHPAAQPTAADTVLAAPTAPTDHEVRHLGHVPPEEVVDGAAEAPWERSAQAITEDIGLTDEALAHLAAGHIKWPEPLTAEWIRDNFQIGLELTQENLDTLAAIAAPFNSDLQMHADQYATWIDVGLRDAWASGAYEKAPMGSDASVSLGDPDEGTVYSSSILSYGWAVRIGLSEDANPHLIELRGTLADLRAQRTQALAVHLKELLGK